MMTILKLTLREMIYYRGRIFLALAAIIAVCCMIVWFIGSFDILEQAAQRDVKNYFGDYDLVILTNRGNLPEKLIAELRADTEHVVRADRGFQVSCNAAREVAESALDKVRRTTGTPATSPTIHGMESAAAPYDVEDGRWFRADSAAEQGVDAECLVSTSARKMLQSFTGQQEKSTDIRLDETLDVTTAAGNFKLKIVGFLKQGISASGLSSPNTRMPGGGGQAPQTLSAELSQYTPGSGVGSAAQTPSTQAPPQAGRGRFRVNVISSSIYVPLEAARKIAGNPDGCNMVYVRLRHIPVEIFREKWEKKWNPAENFLEFHDVESVKEMLAKREDTTRLILAQATGAIGLVLLAAVFIIFTTLSMGVNERTRQLAILRTLGFTRRQVAGMIMLEGVFLGVFGWAGGLLAGWLMLAAIVAMNPGMAAGGVTLSLLTVTVALACSLIGALLASILPAWRATRIAPLDALAQERKLPSEKGIFLAAFCGAGILLTVWLLVFVVPMSDELRGIVASTGGSVITAGAMLLLAPAVIILVEKTLGPVISRMLGMNPAFLANQLSSNKWRTLGTTLSLSIGLGLYVMIQLWGYSMLVPFTPSKGMPNTLVSFLPAGLPYTEVGAVMEIPGVVQEDFMPLALEQPKLAPRMMAGKAGNIINAQMDNVVVFGVDPQIAFRQENPTVNLKFLEGGRREALRALCDTEQRACVIPDTLAKRFDLKVGDQLPLVVPTSAGGGRGGFGGGGRGPGSATGGGPGGGPGEKRPEVKENMPSEAVSTPDSPAEADRKPSGGMKMTAGTEASRSEAERPDSIAESVSTFGGPEQNRLITQHRDPVVPLTTFAPVPAAAVCPHCGLEIGTPGADVKIVEYKIVGIAEMPGWQWLTKTSGVRTQSGRSGGMIIAAYENVKRDFNLTRTGFFWLNTEPGTTHAFLETEMQKIASRASGADSLAAGENVRLAQTARGVSQGFVKVNTHETMMESLGTRANSVIQQMARMPLMILLMTTLAVMNTMIASVRTRRWEMGILRAYGVTRGGLVRLIFAEAVLIGLTACVLSFGFGAFTTLCILKGSASMFSDFLSGVIPALVIPWEKLCVGFAITLGVCVFAAIYPAIRAGMEEPADLLRRKG